MQRPLQWTRSAVTSLVLLLTIGLWTPAFGQETIPSQRRLGNDVVGYFSIRSINDLKAGFGNTMLGRLSEDPEMADFISQLQPLMDQASQGFENESGLKLSEVLAVPQGEFAIAIVHSAGKPMGIIGLLDFGDHRETVDKLLEKMNAELTKDEENATRSEEEIDGTNIVTYTFKPLNAEEGDDEDEQPATRKKAPVPFTLNYCIKDTTLVVSSRTDSLKSVLQRWDGQQERTFAEKPVYKYIAEKCKGDNAEAGPQFVYYFDPIGLFKGALALGEADATTSAMALGFLPSLGLDKFRAIGGSLDLGVGDYDSVSRMVIYAEQPPTAVMNIFQFPARDQAPPAWVPATVTSYSALNWDFDSAYNAVEGLYDTFLGAGSFENAIDQLATEEDGPKIHIKKDLVDQLSGNILFINGDSKEEADPNDFTGVASMVFGLEVKDEGAFASVLQKLAEIPGFPGTAREFEGTKLIQFGAEDTEAPVTPAVCVAKGHLLFATNVTGLEAILRADDDHKPLAEDPQYQAVAKLFPEKTSMRGYQRPDAQLKALYTALKSGALTEAVDDEVPVDLTKLPEFEVIQKYLAPSGGYMVPDEHGWFMLSFSLKPTAVEEK